MSSKSGEQTGRMSGTNASEHDAIVLGAGPAGEVCAGRLATAGLSVAVVERNLVGGECSFYACMPSKALLRPAQALAEARRVPGAAQAVTGELDVAAVLARRDEVVHGLSDGAQLSWLQERGIELVRGHARVCGPREVEVDGRILRARKAIVLATGSSAALPPIPGLREAEPWTNREATTAARVPASLVILGGGVVGVELACAYASLGARVSIIEATDRLIAHEEPFASEQVRAALERQGVEVVLGMRAASVARAGGMGASTAASVARATSSDTAGSDGAGSSATSSGAAGAGTVTVTLTDGRQLSGEELLAATGRRPNTEGMGLEVLGYEPGKPIAVHDTMRTAAHDWLYAIGDVNGRALLTHMGKYQARVAAAHILGRSLPLLSDGALAPRTVLTEPQVAAVGHTLASARTAGIDARAIDVETSANAGASFVGHEAPGTCRLVVDRARGTAVGATFTGAEIAESLHAATIAILGEVPLERLQHAVPCFPTRSELWLYLLQEYGL